MCGIAGLLTTGNDVEARVAAMLASIEHRGRDDEGICSIDVSAVAGMRACLGHRRLSIIDTSPLGHQPMAYAAGRFTISFNGEIYNYRELRLLLKELGHKFITDSDTEVVLAAFAEWGTACLNKLNGMFAFALWDEREQTLTLARDRVGIKPLYYTNLPGADADGIAFASEAKALFASGLVGAQLDLEGLNQYLTFLWTPDPHTLFERVYKLPPGHYLQWRAGSCRVVEWWDITFDNIDEGHSDNWWQEQVLETVDRVVRMEMVADVPLGAFLSGGIDSSIIVALMQRSAGGKKISTFTAGIAAEDLRYDIIPDDAQWARRVRDLVQPDYHELTLKPDVAELLPKLVYHMDAPVIDMAIPSYLIASAARASLKVMLSGMGGDEVFAGYPRQMAMRIASALDPIPKLVRSPLMRMISAILPGGLPGSFTAPLRNAKKFARSAALDFEERYMGFGTYFDDAAKQRLYSAELKAATNGFDAYRYHRMYFDRVRGAAPLNRMLYVDLKTFLPCLNLETTDKTSMAANLEVRVPYLNFELMELTARMPAHLKLRGLKRKYVLKRAAEKLFPHDIVWRKKAGFGAPIRSWLRGPLRPLVADLLSQETVRKRGLFEPREVARILNANESGREDLSLQVFQLLTLELWQRAFLGPGA